MGTPHTLAADAVPDPVPACQPTHPLLTKCYLVTNTAGSLKITESVRYNGVTVSAEKVVRVNATAPPPGGGCDASSAASRIVSGSAAIRPPLPVERLRRALELSASQTLCDDQDPSITITKAAGPNGDAGSFHDVGRREQDHAQRSGKSVDRRGCGEVDYHSGSRRNIYTSRAAACRDGATVALSFPRAFGATRRAGPGNMPSLSATRASPRSGCRSLSQHR